MNSDTFANALQNPGNPTNAPVVLSVWALSSVQELFMTPTGYLNAQVPVVLNVPNSPSSTYNSSNVASGTGAGNSPASSITGIPGPLEEWSADGNPFGITVCGKIAPITASGVFQLWLQAGNGIANNNPGLPGNPANLPLFHTSVTLSASNPFQTNFYLSFECIWDSTSNVLNGTMVNGQISSTNVAQASFQQANCQMSPLSFCLGASLSLQNSNAVTAPATITLREFSAFRI